MATGYSVGNLEMSIQTVGNGAVTSLTLTNAQLKQMLRLLGGNNSQLGKMGGNFNKTFNFAKTLGKLYFYRNYSKQLMQNMAGLVQSAIDYTETLNLWQVSMRGNIDTAEEFISKMNKAYGIAEQTLMKYQATFRNMLSTLGGVSTDVSYALSEYLTQMALDYASLYNTSIEKAMTVFQSVLSGQVRPIRSISGYDITETTIFELYQQLGGTKTMRQLSQTEKRLLRIYAVFQQMDRSGAIGDLNKTLNNTANQMRIMSESAKELGMWFGKLIELYIAPALPYLNAFLITAKNIAQAIVKSLPNYSEFDGTIKGYEETAEAMDEVQGKLLDFDKFRSLSGQEENSLGLGIDENLIAGLTQYQSILENVSNKATEIAEKWTSWWIGDDGKLTEQAENLLAVLKSIGIVLGTLIGYKLITKIGGLIGKITGLKTATALLNSVLATGTVYLILKAVDAFEKGEYWAGALYTALAGATGLVLAIRLLNKASAESLINMAGFLNGLKGTFTSIGVLVGGITLFISSLDKLSSTAKVLIPVLSALAGVVAGLAIAKAGMTFRAAITAGAITAGIGMVVGTLASIEKYADGGMPDKGTVFVAGEAGAEMVYNTPSGQSGVANIQQIQQAMYGALVAYGRTQGSGASDDRPIDIYIDGEKVFQATKKNAKRHGYAFAKV